MEIRKEIFNQVESILKGPVYPYDKDKESAVNPLDFHITGILYPQLLSTQEIEDNAVNEEERIYSSELSNENDQEEGSDNDNNAAKNLTKFHEDTTDDMLELSTKFRPSVAGISFIIKRDTTIKVNISYATYNTRSGKHENNKGHIFYKTLYKREFHNEELEITLDQEENLITKYKGKHINGYTDELAKNASLSVVKRIYPGQDSKIITLSLINLEKANSFGQQRKVDECLFEISINTEVISGESFQPFIDQTKEASLKAEDINLKLLYRHYKKFALGHGISVNWNFNDTNVNYLYTQVLPTEEVNGMDMNPHEFTNKDILYIKKLSGKKINNGNYDWQQVKSELHSFINLYYKWIEEQQEKIDTNNEDLSEHLIDRANKNLTTCRKLYERMQGGIDALDQNPDARKAFEDANKAMFMQRVMGDFSKHRRETKRVQHDNTDFDDPLPVFSAVLFDSLNKNIWEEGRLKEDLKNLSNKENLKPLARWYPFQLAFLLSQINGIIDGNHVDRDTIDLIWFPTGGGKTEAYLGLTAFNIFYRRLKAKNERGNPDSGAGVSVLMRYTLRLLNKQQFERASVLIAACDLIRRNEPENYGEERISNGIWVGSSLTPNKIKNDNGQIKQYQEYIRKINRNEDLPNTQMSPPILTCPACGNRLVKETSSYKNAVGRWGYFRRKDKKRRPVGPYIIACTNTQCDFHTSNSNFEEGKTLPVYEVDEVIYQKRPTLLFSTVDKFVQLAWKKECNKLFNLESNNNDNGVYRVFPSPELILQDELHLINSALGTSYGVFEYVIDTLSKAEGGIRAKVVSATATAREAKAQTKRLYARSHFMQFPPPGIDADDSFYAKKKKEDDKARMYVGFMPSGVTTSTALIRLTSALLERIPALGQYNNKQLDPYYTLVVYFNAIKELGKFRTFLEDDISAYREFLANHFNTVPKKFAPSRVNELSSVLTADEITKSLDKLEKTTLPGNKALKNEPQLQDELYYMGIRTLNDFQNASNRKKLTNRYFFNRYGLPYVEEDPNLTKEEKYKIRRTNYHTLLEYLKNHIGDQDPAHVAPATSMISVGVDIPRLNTMIINGQPKTSAEYIQASSRVGREEPGIILTFLAPTKNRDRSHYEQFKDFHQAYYKSVEASSVTPNSEQALEKMLPTAIIAILKSLNTNTADIKNNIDSLRDDLKGRFPPLYIDKVIEELKNKIDNLQSNRRLAEYMDYLIYDPTTNSLRNTISQDIHFVYNAPANLTNNKKLRSHISTLNSLRNVEQNSGVKIK